MALFIFGILLYMVGICRPAKTGNLIVFVRGIPLETGGEFSTGLFVPGQLH